MLLNAKMQNSLFLLSSFCSLLIWLGRAFLEMDFIFLGLEVIFRLGPPLASTTCMEERRNQYWMCLHIWSWWPSIWSIISVLRSKLTWFQFFLVPTGSFFHRFTSSTQALQISPDRVSLSLQDNYSMWRNGKIFQINKRNVIANTLRRISLQTLRFFQQCLLPKTAPEVFLVPLTVRETRAWRLCAADAAAVQTPVHFWLMKAKHLSARKYLDINISGSYRCAWCVNCSTSLHPWFSSEVIFLVPFQFSLYMN